jgi:regulator of protease activity HflC (stomatin/prohibitin superfamily)
MIEKIVIGVGILLVIPAIIGIFLGIGYVSRTYNVWAMEMNGRAELAQAEWSKKVAVEESKAKKESAIYEAEAEIERARGVAESNRIIADGLGGSEGYLRYLYINTLQDLNTSIIYVPTEAGLPVLEAGKR